MAVDVLQRRSFDDAVGDRRAISPTDDFTVDNDPLRRSLGGLGLDDEP